MDEPKKSKKEEIPELLEKTDLPVRNIISKRDT